MAHEDDPPVTLPTFRSRLQSRIWDATRIALPAIMLLLTSSGCLSIFDEVHYFKSVDKNNRPVNYYRVRVWGDTFLSSSRYVSGYYDEASLDAYFNTISQPKNGVIVPVADEDVDANPKVAAKSTGDDAEEVKPLAPDKDGRKLVLLLSSNSDEIARGISAMAQSSAVATTLSNLVGSARFKDAASLTRKAQMGTVRGGVLADEVTHVLDSVADGPGDAKDQFLSVANDLGSFIGARRSFKTLKDAQDWLLEHAGRDE